MKWTTDNVREFIIEAADTLHRLPDPERGYLFQTKVCWPLMMKDPGEEFANAVNNNGKWEEVKVRMGPPTREALGRYEMVMGWLQYITGSSEVRDRKIVFFACYSMARFKRQTINWSMVQNMIGARLHPRSMRRIYTLGLEKIAGKLTSQGIEIIE